MKINNKFIAIGLVTTLALTACKRDDGLVVYDVNSVTVGQPGANKANAKSTNEFISIAYSDLFGTTISNADLTDLALSYVSFGDKKLVEDMTIRNFLQKPGVNIPSNAEMRADVDLFVVETYKKFYNRDPNELEAWQVADLIITNDEVTPELVYYAFMTSNEYRYY